jgi:hypothetical protein
MDRISYYFQITDERKKKAKDVSQNLEQALVGNAGGGCVDLGSS